MKAKEFFENLACRDWPKARLRAECLVAFECECQYCEKPGTYSKGPDGKAWHLDRQLPGVYGGEYEPDNVILSCATCNLVKGGKHPSEDVKWESKLTLGILMFMAQRFSFIEGAH